MRIDEAYAEVERITRERAKNFAYGIMVLPREKRRAIAAIYAFAREVDDVADGSAPVEEKRARLEALRVALDDPPAAHQAQRATPRAALASRRSAGRRPRRRRPRARMRRSPRARAASRGAEP